jgi:hypothetical protein
MLGLRELPGFSQAAPGCGTKGRPVAKGAEIDSPKPLTCAVIAANAGGETLAQ